MSNPDYWQERAEKRIHSAHKNSDKTIKEITAAYQQAIDDLNKDIEKIFYRYAKKNDLSSVEAKDILNQKISESEWNQIKLQISSIKDPVIKKQLRAKLEASTYGSRIDRLEALKQDIYIKTKQVADVELQKSTELYKKTVEDNYLHNVFDFQQGTGYAYEFASMSPEHVEEILKNNWSGKHYSKSVWDNTDVLAEKLQQTLTAGLMSGKSYKRMAAELTELTSYGQYATERLIRTETAYLIEESDKAAAIDRGTKVRIFRATLDRKTSKICQEHDGDRIPIEKSVPGKNVPPLHPHCRSWMEEEIEGYEHRIRAARDPETGERITVPADMKYADWKNEYASRLNGTISENIDKHTIAEGRSLIGVYKKRTSFQYEIEDIINLQGFDGKPKLIVDEEEFYKAVDEDHFIAERTFSDDSKEQVETWYNELKEGEFYVKCTTGGFQYGRGMYCAADYTKGTIEYSKFQHEIEQYAWGKKHVQTTWMTMEPSAKIIKFEDLQDKYAIEWIKVNRPDNYEGVLALSKLQNKVRNYHKNWDPVVGKPPQDYMDLLQELKEKRKEFEAIYREGISASNKRMQEDNYDWGILAAELGYDAINAKHGATGSYTVVLNRTKLIIFDGSGFKYRKR